MALASTRSVRWTIAGGTLNAGSFSAAAANNANSPGINVVQNLASGLNTITVPTAGTVPTAVTIIPPASNSTSITLKGVTGDTGIRLHNTDPTTLALDSSVTSFVLTTGGAITGVRFVWT